VPPLAGLLVVDLTRYLPGEYAGRELLRLGARVVRIEPPDGEPLRETAPAWDRALNAGKESVVCDLKSQAGLTLARALLARADVVLEGFRPDVAARLGVGPDDARADAVYCSITGFGADGPHVQRAGHDLNYLGWAGALADTAPALPPLQIADLAAGALGAVTQILAALLEGGGVRITVSMTHRAHDLVAHRVGGEPLPKLLTGGVACYRIYATADGRFLTVAALEPKFWQRLCELVDLPELIGRQWEPRLPELERAFASRSLGEWLELFDGEDVSVGPVATLEDAAQEFSTSEQLGPAPRLGEHTSAWRTELGL
jgi:crotonobetainyl-CoA:carnitine CoA-transferase CaiB-like acyl-CoA transferase